MRAKSRLVRTSITHFCMSLRFLHSDLNLRVMKKQKQSEELKKNVRTGTLKPVLWMQHKVSGSDTRTLRPLSACCGCSKFLHEDKKKNSPLGFTSWQNHSEAQADLYRKLQRCQNASRQSNLNRSALYTSCPPVTTLVVDKIRDGFFSTWKVLADTTTRECEVLFWMKRS